MQRYFGRNHQKLVKLSCPKLHTATTPNFNCNSTPVKFNRIRRKYWYFQIRIQKKTLLPTQVVVHEATSNRRYTVKMYSYTQEMRRRITYFVSIYVCITIMYTLITYENHAYHSDLQVCQHTACIICVGLHMDQLGILFLISNSFIASSSKISWPWKGPFFVDEANLPSK